MPTEIERKFLVINDSWRERTSHAVKLRDGLIANLDGRKVRVRFYDHRATLTIKGPRQGISRDEFEYDIPAEDGNRLIAQHCSGDVLEKTRYHIPCEGLEWTVDEYHGLLDGIVMTEIELPSEDTPFSIPPWVGQEVTGQSEYRQINLLRQRQKNLQLTA